MDAQATFSCSFTQSDLGPVAELPSLPRWPAQRLLPQERQDLAVQVLAGAQPVSDLAREHEVSRKFLYQQAHTAEDALTQAFDPDPKTDDGPLPPACNQGLVAATGPGPGVDRPQPVPGRRRIAPRPLRLAHLPGYGAQHRPQRRRTGSSDQPRLRSWRRAHRCPR